MNKINEKVVRFRQDFNTSWMLTEWLRYKYNSSLQTNNPDNLVSLNKLTQIQEEILEAANKQKEMEIEELTEKYESRIDKLNKEIIHKQDWIDELLDKNKMRDVYQVVD